VVNKDLRILLISPLPPPAGGIATWTKQYMKWIKENGFNIDIVNTAVIGKRANRIASKMNWNEEMNRTRKILVELNRQIRVFNPNVVHLNTACGRLGIFRDYICARIVKKNNIRLIVHYRCNIEDQIGTNSVQKLILKKLANLANVNIILNNSSKLYLDKISSIKSIFIPNFIEKSYLLDFPKTITEDVKRISFVGHVQKFKGVYEIIETAKFFPDIEFKLVGPVAKDVARLDLPPNIHLLGVMCKEEIRKVLRNSDVFLFPSYTEGFANALLEAMSLGVPIITTPVGANKDMIEEFGGIIVKVGDVKEISDAILKIKSLVLRNGISTWNINKVKNNYTIESVMSQLIDLY
jgi:glycosyltransferase involved in cell wall biosynthesis